MELYIMENNSDQLSERLTSVGIIGAQLKVPLKSLRPSQYYRNEGFKGIPPPPHYVYIRQSLGQPK